MHRKSHEFEDIDNLNEEIYKSDEPILLNEEEKREFRKKILIILAIVILFMSILIAYNVHSSKELKKKQENNKKVEKTNTIQRIVVMDDGDIPISNVELSSYSSVVALSLFNDDVLSILPLYRDSFIFDQLDDQYKLYYLSQTEAFESLLKSKGIDSCDSKETLTSLDLSFLLAKHFNSSLKSGASFTTLLNFNNKEYTNFEYLNGEYIPSCKTFEETEDTVYIRTQLSKASKSGDDLTLVQKALFITIDGIFADPNFSIKLNDDPNHNTAELFVNANEFSFTFKYGEEGYYLYEKK